MVVVVSSFLKLLDDSTPDRRPASKKEIINIADCALSVTPATGTGTSTGLGIPGTHLTHLWFRPRRQGQGKADNFKQGHSFSRVQLRDEVRVEAHPPVVRVEAVQRGALCGAK